MALKRNETYPGRFNNPTTSHPQGAFKNRTAPGAQDGSYLEQQWANDWDGFFGRLLTLAGITPNGNADTALSSQYYDALSQLFVAAGSLGNSATRNVGTTSGTVAAGDDSRFGMMIGVGQTWQDFTGSRSAAVTYTNSTGKPIMVFASVTINATQPTATMSVNSIATAIASGSNWPTNFIMRGQMMALVPPGSTYRLDGGFSLSQWTELR